MFVDFNPLDLKTVVGLLKKSIKYFSRHLKNNNHLFWLMLSSLQTNLPGENKQNTYRFEVHRVA
jgi:hypothetical protein